MEHRPFCCSVKGFVKMLRLVSAGCRVEGGVQESRTLTPFHPKPFLHTYPSHSRKQGCLVSCLEAEQGVRHRGALTWDTDLGQDILNSLVAAIFMIIISVLALIPETTKYTVLGGVFGLLAVVCCIADAALIYRKLLFNPSGPYQKKAIHDEI
ncbi:Chemokine-like factor [Myotis brandtii]|uniref:Chemokine-like factor n=1 Tax=Myotis brandtii TaxID=109478 RepID=S7NAF3_MYOBR|nr:Chemokine-like factor [Myotis brandtii]